jgi:hypothetical protein
MHRSPSDELLLTELAIDAKDFVIFDVSSVVLVGERTEKLKNGAFKCYMDNELKEFFVEVNSGTHLQAFTKTVVLNLLNTAEEAGAKRIFMCLRKSIEQHGKGFLFLYYCTEGNAFVENFMRSFSFLGFQRLGEKEVKKISMTQTHTLLVYDFDEEGEL